LVDDCAQSGGGGNYLSNEVAYRNTNMRDIFGLQIPAGHIHTPVVNNFAATPAGTAPLYTDSTYEAWRDAIVQQGRNLFFSVGRNLGRGRRCRAPRGRAEQRPGVSVALLAFKPDTERSLPGLLLLDRPVPLTPPPRIHFGVA
jgi:hypothetical protein